MNGIVDLKILLKSMSPELQSDEYVFCSLPGEYGDYQHLMPLASFREKEGLTLVVTKNHAEQEGIEFESTFKVITLTIHSSLDAVGLTAEVARKLTEHNISANVIAAYYHDHILVQTEKADAAMLALYEFSA
jgi:hypothetical protein